MEGTDMKEAIQDEFRQWYMEYKRLNGKFPEFPADEVWQQPNFKFSIDHPMDASAGKGGMNLTPEAEKATPTKKEDAKAETKEKKEKGDKGGKGKQEEEIEDPLLKYNFGSSVYLDEISKQ
jgi:IQ and AAA domain-containing protein